MVVEKKACPITRKQFTVGANPMTVNINGQQFVAEPRQFATGSLGWYINGKVSVTIDGVACPVQVGCNLTVAGSKELPTV